MRSARKRLPPQAEYFRTGYRDCDVVGCECVNWPDWGDPASYTGKNGYMSTWGQGGPKKQPVVRKAAPTYTVLSGSYKYNTPEMREVAGAGMLHRIAVPHNYIAA